MAKNNTGQAFWVSVGNLVALIFTIGATMVMSRIYTKVDYGTYRQIFWVYSSLTVVFTLGLPRAFGYFLPRVSFEEAHSLTNKITRIFFVMGGVFSVLLFVLSDLIASALNNQDLSIGLKIFSPVPFFLLPTMGLDSIYATYKRTEVSAVYHIISKAILAICLVLSAILYRHSYIYAIIGFNIASIISFGFALFLKNLPFKGIQQKRTTVSFKEIFAFSLPLMGANIVNILINSTDQFFISRYFGVVEFAEFSNGAMELPFIGMIVGACSVVLLPIYSSIKSKGEVSECKNEILSLWRSVIEKCMKLIYPLVIFCIIFSTEIMVVLYGEEYRQSGIFFKIMLFNNFFAIISTYPLILALNKVKQYMKLYIYNALLLIFLELCCVYLFKNIYIVCVISVLCLAIRNISFLFLISNELKEKACELIPWRILFSIVLIAMVACLISKITSTYVDIHPIANLIFTFISSTVLYLLIAHGVHLDYISIIRPLLPKLFHRILK